MAQIVDHRDLIATFQPGDMPASERIVRVYQNEIVRTAFLLSGTAEGAILLARDAFLSYFRRLVQGDAPDDPRMGLLEATGASFLVDPKDRADGNGSRPGDSLAGTVAYDAGENRYRVEDDRSRVLALLDLLDRPTRLGVVLRDFNALEEEPVCRILGEIPYTLRQQLHPARDRIRDAAGVGPDYAVRELLVNAATSAPRPNLWPEVVEPLEDFYAREDARRQRLTYIAAGVVGVLLVLAGLWLFDLLPFGGSDDGSAALATTATPTPAATATPTITPTSIPSLSSFAISQGDIPDKLVLSVFGTEGTEDRTETGYLDTATNTFQLLPSGIIGGISPDGRTIFSFRVDESSNRTAPLPLVAITTETGEERWVIELPRPFYSFAVAGNRVYVAVLAEDGDTTQEAVAPELRAYDLETGELVETWEDLIPALQTAVSESFQLSLLTSPDEQRLFVAVEEFGSSPTLVSSRTLASYSLPDMTFESSSVQTDSTASRQFPTEFQFAEARVTPDGEFIYRVDESEELVQFRSSDASKDLDLSVTFVQERQADDAIQWTVSNDGRYLYIVALSRAEVAIVDLLARRVERVFPLAFAPALADQQTVLRAQAPIGSGLGAGLSISRDGEILYLVGIRRPSSGLQIGSHVWIVDLRSWTVVASQGFDDFVLGAAELGDALAVTSVQQSDTGTPNRRVRLLDLQTGEMLSEFAGEGLPEWSESFFSSPLVEFYRFHHARAPAVDHVAYASVETESTLPRLSVVATGETIPAGKAFDMAVRLLNPFDGQRMTEVLPSVRLDENATVILRLVHAEGAAEDVILIGNRTGLGWYTANAALLETGFWNAEVTVSEEDGAAWEFTIEEIFQIVPSWEASDGRRYMLDVQVEPAQPEVDQPAAISAHFVDVDSGRPLPENVELTGGVPDTVRVVFDSNGVGVTSANLQRGADGSYTDEDSFWRAGDWSIVIELENDAGERFNFDAGTLTVVAGDE